MIKRATINTFPNNVESIGEDAFRSCEALTSVSIGSGVKSIGETAFSYCSNLESVTIPESVIKIGDGAFHCCTKLKAIHCEWTRTNPPAHISNDNPFGPFDNSTYQTAVLYVPEWEKEPYEYHYLIWSRFNNIVEE